MKTIAGGGNGLVTVMVMVSSRLEIIFPKLSIPRNVSWLVRSVSVRRKVQVVRLFQLRVKGAPFTSMVVSWIGALPVRVTAFVPVLKSLPALLVIAKVVAVGNWLITK